MAVQHTGGESLRIPISGLPPIYGNTVIEKRRYFMKHYDHIRTGLMLEPRGHADMYGAILTRSNSSKADLDCIFLNGDGYSPMCGHATLAITKVAFETTLVKRKGAIKKLTIAVPAGLVHAEAHMADEMTVTKTSFQNVHTLSISKISRSKYSGLSPR
jgi:trans-L-3-hydroxyproline dehydratase